MEQSKGKEVKIVSSVLEYLRAEVKDAYIDALRIYAPELVVSMVSKLKDTYFWRFGANTKDNKKIGYYPQYADYSLRAIACRIYEERQKAKMLDPISENYPQIGGEYFVMSKSKGKEGNKTKIISEYLDFIGCEGDSFVDKMRTFVKRAQKVDYERPEITDDDRSLQEKYLEDLTDSLTKLIKIEEFSQPSESKKFDFLSRFKDTSKWWFYFYAYDIDKETKRQLDKAKRWQLIRLVLTIIGTNFEPTDNNKLRQKIKVRLQNVKKGKTANRHYNYTGHIDLGLSNNKVLVLNLRTEEYDSRQLNIKLAIPNPKGTFFVGQYLNYDNDGEIYSGTVIIEQTKELKPKPKIYNITNDLEFHNLIEKEEVGHVAAYFQDRSLNFRRCPKNIHNVRDFQEWKKTENR